MPSSNNTQYSMASWERSRPSSAAAANSTVCSSLHDGILYFNSVYYCSIAQVTTARPLPVWKIESNLAIQHAVVSGVAKKLQFPYTATITVAY